MSIFEIEKIFDVEIVLIIYSFDMIDKIISKTRIKFDWKREKI